MSLPKLTPTTVFRAPYDVDLPEHAVAKGDCFLLGPEVHLDAEAYLRCYDPRYAESEIVQKMDVFQMKRCLGIRLPGLLHAGSVIELRVRDELDEPFFDEITVVTYDWSPSDNTLLTAIGFRDVEAAARYARRLIHKRFDWYEATWKRVGVNLKLSSVPGLTTGLK